MCRRALSFSQKRVLAEAPGAQWAVVVRAEPVQFVRILLEGAAV
jgi:hypothetical protein